MKKVLIYFAMAVVLALGSTSCSDFLEIEPVGAVNETNLTDQEGINYLLTGMYSALNIPAATTNSYFGASLTNYTYGDVMGGDAWANRSSAVGARRRKRATGVQMLRAFDQDFKR